MVMGLVDTSFTRQREGQVALQGLNVVLYKILVALATVAVKPLFESE